MSALLASSLTRLLLPLALFAFASCQRAPAATVTPELVGRNNRAVGLMGQFDFTAAAEVMTEILADAPDWPEGRLNLAIAVMNRQGPGDTARAEAMLGELQKEQTVSRRVQYLLGLIMFRDERRPEALRLLTGLATGNSPDAFAAYFAGQTLLADTPAEAFEWFRRAATAQPLFRSAYYGAFLALRRSNREAEAADMLARFQELEHHPQAVVAELKYTRMGPLAEAITFDLPGAGASTPPGPRFNAPAPLVGGGAISWRRGGPPRSISVADLNGDDALDLFIANALDGPSPNAVIVRQGSTHSVDLAHPLARVGNVKAALWGDLDEDGRVDLVLCRPSGGTQIWKQASAGEWVDITIASGARVSGTDVVDGAIFDADHDGDLDIWLVNGAGPNELLNNDGGGRFRAIGRAAGVAGDGRPSLGIAVADLDHDRDADVIVLKASPPHDVFVNGRVWTYRRDDRSAELAAAQFSALVAGDMDADGETELYSAGGRGIERWRRDATGPWRPETLVSSGAAVASRLAIADTNGDGVLELIASTGREWTIIETAAQTSGRTIAPVATGGTAAPGGWSVAHLDVDAGPSVVGVAEDGAPTIWRPGSGRHAYLALLLSGRDPNSNQRRSNVSGLGARVAVRTASRWTAFETTRLESGPGQSLQPTSIGLGGSPRADFVAITWSDGVFQTELALDAGRLHRIGETQRQLSSCPVLFAWDGTSFRFVTDVLGAGGIGFFERPGVYSTPFPRENVLLPDAVAAVTNGAYRLKLAEPMEEVTYLDQASLTAYDLPPGWRMSLDERKAVAGPAPTGAPIFYREEQLPVRAENDAGTDVTETLSVADHLAVGPTLLNPRFIGLARSFSVTVTFDRPIDRGRPVLLVDGWLEYPYAQTVFAAWQAGIEYEAPTLEARDRRGQWHTVARQFGYPAGMPRQMALPLPPLPSGTVALRLRTSQEIYWDRIAVVYAEALPGVRRHGLPLRAATLGAGGFARRTTGANRLPHYEDGARAPLADTRHQRGWYTELGSVEPLIADEDGALLIFGPGEDVTFEFVAPLAPLGDGWTRRLVLELRGWCKDMDLYTRDGETIEPLPGRHTDARARLHRRFNTRYAAGF